jgi:subtilisin family serine protease
VSRGTTVVVAVGNSNTNASGFTPANCGNVVTVAASDREGDRASYSNYGSIVGITVPGGETAVSAADGILSTLNSSTTTPGSETYRAYQGTSMATPHIVGLAALMYEKNPAVTPAQVESLIQEQRPHPARHLQRRLRLRPRGRRAHPERDGRRPHAGPGPRRAGLHQLRRLVRPGR